MFKEKFNETPIKENENLEKKNVESEKLKGGDLDYKSTYENKESNMENMKKDELKELVMEETGWSSEIAEKIETYEQYEVYSNANLTEATINGKKCLIKKIDLDYVDEKTGLTNRELMEKGRSPYDSKTGEKIELHHMGQDADGPFAELNENSEHGNGNHSILHLEKENSWRNNPDLKQAYANERREYLKARSQMEG